MRCSGSLLRPEQLWLVACGAGNQAVALHPLFIPSCKHWKQTALLGPLALDSLTPLGAFLAAEHVPGPSGSPGAARQALLGTVTGGASDFALRGVSCFLGSYHYHAAEGVGGKPHARARSPTAGNPPRGLSRGGP